MEETEIKIKIDSNGNIHREVVDRQQPKERKPGFLKRIFTTQTL